MPLRTLSLSLILLHLCTTTLGAQTCWSDAPIYVEDFGSGPGDGPELPPGTTTYTFGSIGGGNYVVTNNSGLNGSLWHNSPDRTPGDDNGYMLLFDAAADPGTFFRTTVDGLCENTNYIFSCFVANIVTPTACGGFSTEPDLRFSAFIPGSTVLLGTTTTGPIPTTPEMSWGNYIFIFRTQSGQTSIELEVTNNAPGGCGNDLVIDDFSLSICNPIVVQSIDLCNTADGTVTVGDNIYTVPGTYEDVLPVANSCHDSTVVTTLTGQQVALPPIDLRFCAGESVTVNGIVYDSSITFVDTLLPGSNCPQYQPYVLTEQQDTPYEQTIFLCNGDSVRVGNNWYTASGFYVDSLISSVGCDSVLHTTIEAAAIAVSVFPATHTLELGESVTLDAEVTLTNSFDLSWSPSAGLSCLDCPSPKATPIEDIVYTLFASDPNSGCVDSTQVQINVTPCAGVYIPNVFSPNFDGANDHFTIHAKNCFQRIQSLQIFDRWGGLVFEQRDQPIVGTHTAWDGSRRGQAASEGVYVYVAILERIDGSQERIAGDIVLLR
ncbi:MAG: gliding motility-associated C-terminal domain-containing protein [Bacteroidota bacterium]